MSVSIAVVNKEDVSELHNIIEMNEKITEVKRYLKNFSGSKFMADRRNDKGSGLRSPQIYKREYRARGSYKPLGQILLEKNMISKEVLDEALAVHWRRGVVLGEVLKELNLVPEKELAKILEENAPGVR
jgi:type IV pilus assembly protein PilB